MARRRKFTPSRSRLRNLTQYKDLTDDEFEEIYLEQYGQTESTEADWKEMGEELEVRINKKLVELEVDYDLSDMKANDLMQLRALILALLQLEDLELESFAMRKNLTEATVYKFDKINRLISNLRTDISNISNDLQLTRKERSRSKDVGVAQKWEQLIKAASRFYDRKMLYVFCPECKQLLLTAWVHYKDREQLVKLNCGKCENTFQLNLVDLYSTKNRNLEEVVI